MIIKWKSEYIGHVGFSALPEDYDGIPRFANYWLDSAPKTRHADRESLAAFLIFNRYMGGLTHMPQKFSPALDSAFRAAAGGMVSFTPVEYYPKALPSGSRTLHLSWADAVFVPASMRQSAEDAYLHIERSDRSSGSMRTINRLDVASNAWIHSRGELRSLESIFPYLAAAVLYAEELEVDTIQIYGDFDTQSDLWKKLVLLLGSARLGLKLGQQ